MQNRKPDLGIVTYMGSGQTSFPDDDMQGPVIIKDATPTTVIPLVISDIKVKLVDNVSNLIND
jgi:hypothetical protein